MWAYVGCALQVAALIISLDTDDPFSLPSSITYFLDQMQVRLVLAQPELLSDCGLMLIDVKQLFPATFAWNH